MEILPAMQGSNLKGELLLSAVLPLLKLFSMTAIGLLLAHPKYQLVPKLTFTLLSKLVFAIFLPCLIFTNLGPSISLKNFVNWWFIPVNVVISTAIGCVLGLLVAVICRPPPQFFRFTVIMTAFGNTVVEEKENHGIAQLGSDQNGNGNRDESDLARPLLVEAEWPGIEDKEIENCKTPLIARLFNSSNGVLPHTSLSELGEEEEGGYPRSTKPSQCLAEPRIARKIRSVAWRTPIDGILQPPTIAFLLAIVIGMIPTLKSLVFDDNQVLSFLTDSLGIVAEAMVPSAVLVLGGMLAEGPNESNLGMRTTIGIIVARLLVLPFIGIGVVLLSDKLNLLVADDQLYRFVLLLQYTTPSAILLGAVASLRGYSVREASALLFWQHIVAVFSLSLYIIVYFYLLF
ncbi:protein PIN-LIKES 2-like isoform X3 [Malus sylvestris]|uniref:protein PIN-LIKES 2-like isoform X3 n=1 Tax=Malus sylvestris TaxID=3752 RepID=UPI0021AD4C9B|nr:protein PIN-LIKES 2-like isoform X3 [Malus sylvestris]